ncbi:MAG: PAS domain-containing sensor histidine kinase [Gammaproteobacteria bacterium]|nr:PAS domain-containing sensor histidine kinase [Gammaproteobacteria bacterium]
MTTPTALSTSALQDAFATFNQLSVQLASSYHALERRVGELNEELACSHDARLRELTAKECLAQRLATLLQVLPGGVVVLDGSGCVQEYNQVAAELLGLPLSGGHWAQIIQRAFAPRGDDGHEVSLVDGRRVTIATCPMANEPGQILLLTDVTELRHLQDRLAQQQRLAAMGEMAAGLAHQIRTPLASALLYSSQLQHPQLDRAAHDRFVQKIHSRLAHLEHIVNDMLMYARGGVGVSETFNCSTLLQDLEHCIDPQVFQSRTHFSWRNDTTDRCLSGNRQMLVSALTNLAINAIQAMGSGGRLRVVARHSNPYNIEIAVSDNGPGMSEEQLSKIFDPFFTTRGDGTGLGLAVVHAIVRAHKGEILVDSTPNQGSTFVVQLPAVKALQQPSATDNVDQFKGARLDRSA